MDKIKQVGVIILLIAVIFSFSPIEGRQTYAAGHAGNTGKCKWEYDQNTNSLHIYGNGDMGNYDENNTAPWCPLDPINGDEDLVVKTVVIDDGVTNVGSFAFYGCVELASITMPDSITNISTGALMYCESLRSVKIPDKVASIGDLSFFECEELTSIDIPDSVGSIGKDAFEGCKSLVNVKLGKGLEEIRSGAFYDTGLHSIRVPQSVDWIDYHAFGYIDDDDDDAKKVSDFEMVVASGSEGERYADDNGFKITYYSTSESSDESQTAVQKRIASSSSSKKYKVKFDANRGKVKTKSKTVYKSKTYGKLPKPKRSGYVFKGWYTKKTGGSKITASTKVTKSNDHTLYAHWKLKKYKINYKGVPKGSKNPNRKTYTIKIKKIKLKKASNKGYDFEGWYSDKNKTKKITTLKIKRTGTKTVYSKWMPHQYIIVFNPNGGKGTMASMKSRKYGETYTLTKNTFKKNGYVFKGWSTSPKGKGTIYKNKEKVKNLTSDHGGLVTLYAQWKPDKTEGEQIVDFAKEFIGCTYELNNHGPEKFDCSGFVYYVFKEKYGIELSTGSSDYWNNPKAFGTVVEEKNALPGDVVSWSGHVGIYIGNGKVINALNPTSGVCIMNIANYCNSSGTQNPPHKYIRIKGID